MTNIKMEENNDESKIILNFNPVSTDKIQLGINKVNKRHGISISEIEIY